MTEGWIILAVREYEEREENKGDVERGAMKCKKNKEK